jgi:hypothetical protein
VVSAIANMIAAAKVTLVRMTPTSGVDQPREIHWRFSCRESVNYLTHRREIICHLKVLFAHDLRLRPRPHEKALSARFFPSSGNNQRRLDRLAGPSGHFSGGALRIYTAISRDQGRRIGAVGPGRSHQRPLWIKSTFLSRSCAASILIMRRESRRALCGSHDRKTGNVIEWDFLKHTHSPAGQDISYRLFYAEC